MIFGLVLVSGLTAHGAQTFNIDFRNASWNHNTVSGLVTSNGWGRPSPTAAGYNSGFTQVAPGVTLTVSSQFFGTASPGPENFTLDPVNTPGFAFQNAGTGDTNFTNDAFGRTVLNNYQRIDFRFSTPVTMNSLRISDIDTSSTISGNGYAWRDTVGLELWQRNVPIVPGTGIDPTITLSNPSNLQQSITSGGLPYTYANLPGNTTAPNPAPLNDPSTATFTAAALPVDGFSIYLWNRGMGTGSKHAVVLQATGNTLTVVPEVSVSVLSIAGMVGLIATRRRRGEV